MLNKKKNILYILLILTFSVVGYSTVRILNSSTDFESTQYPPGISVVYDSNRLSLSGTSTSNTYDPYSCVVDPKIGTSTDVYTKGYKLFKARYYGYPDQGTPCQPLAKTIRYVDDGVVSSGQYANYHRLLAFYQAYDDMYQAEDFPFYFISKDFKDFKLVKKGNVIGISSGDDGDDDLQKYINENLDTTKVTGLVDNLEFSHPDTLTFGLFEYSLIGFENEQTSTLQKLGTSGDLDIFETGIKVSPYGFAHMDYATSSLKAAFAQLPAYYSAVTKIKAKNIKGVFADYEISMKQNSKDDIKTSTGRVLSKQMFVGGMFFGDDVVTTEKIAASYGQVTPTPCAGSEGSYIMKHITQDELRLVGKMKSGVDVYTFKNKQHPILKAQYEEKINQYDDQMFKELNEVLGVLKKPSYDEYVSVNPVLLFKDSWGRFVVVGEHEYMLNGGCGKPVIYLYPKDTTRIHIEFKNDIQLTTQIPEYKKGWDVVAEKTGVLHNIASTTCDIYKKVNRGSEYAHEACVNNEYPYIYWAGNVFKDYPSIEEGFIVKKESLKMELEDKLKDIGLSEKEIGDMVSYWYPEMLKKNAPFYRISFFKTEDVNSFIPMSVSPKPDSVLRIFLDWEPLQNASTITPQMFKPFVRNGFTYIEWGGLKR